MESGAPTNDCMCGVILRGKGKGRRLPLMTVCVGSFLGVREREATPTNGSMCRDHSEGMSQSGPCIIGHLCRSDSEG